GLVDLALLDLLRDHFVQDEKEVEKLLDSGSMSPLGSLGARIQMSYLLGLIGKDHFILLKELKNLRNAFAHRIDFDLKHAIASKILRKIATVYPVAFSQPGVDPTKLVDFTKLVEETGPARGLILTI